MANMLYYGVHVPSLDISQVLAFEANAQKPVAIVMWYQHWGVSDGYQNLQPDWMSTVRSHGSIPLVTWMPWNPPQGINQPAYSLEQIIQGRFNLYIQQWAQDSNAWGYPYFLRFAPEMNGNWNPWSEQVNANKAGQFVLAWRHVHDIFTAQGVTNVTWIWCPNINYSTSTPLHGLYPGDAYVDWVAMDGYNWGPLQGHAWQSFATVFQSTYHDIGTLTTRPLMIAETASTEEGGNKASWILDAFETQILQTFPRIKAVIWFNENKETDWRIESSSAAKSAFARVIQTPHYASNTYATQGASPIPVP